MPGRSDVERLLVIPAAGRGTRLGWSGPKVLFPLAGRPMIDHLFERYRPWVDRVVVVAAPDALETLQAHLAARRFDADCVVQPEPNGMLPAILCALRRVETIRPRQVWITWCDQVGISGGTAKRLADAMAEVPEPAFVFPTVRQEPPYIHFARDAGGRIADVRQRREGDDMPAIGESDAGLFAMTLETFTGSLVDYDRGAVARGGATAERNFLPFIPWLSARASVRTFDVPDTREAVGVNTMDDVRTLEAYLRDEA